ncbi:MAG: hypothetical protein QXY07_02660 [Candidatus Bathyarchaeia archaeon]
MSHYELDEIRMRIKDLNIKIEYLFEHPVIQELNRQVEELSRRMEDLETVVENLQAEIDDIKDSMLRR